MRGFTIIELLVVLAISALFSTLAITYSSVGRNTVALTVEESKISQFILQAKQLSIATYASGGTKSCGYGVVFNLDPTPPLPQTYSIFSYDPGPGDPTCPSGSITGISSDEEKPYTDGTWQVPISSGVRLASSSDNLAAILFYPPVPTVFLSSDGATFSTTVSSLNVYLESVDGENNKTMAVNSEGQITF